MVGGGETSGRVLGADVDVALPGANADRFVFNAVSDSTGVTASARNLALFTRYTGIDPEMNYGTADVQNEFQTSPPQRYVLLRANFGF